MQLSYAKNTIRIFQLFGLFILSSGLSLQANERGMIPTDYFEFVNVLSPVVSPKSDDILFVKQTVNEKKDGREHQLYLLTEDGELRAFTQGKNDTRPQWSPDGASISFIRKVNDKPQIFLMPKDGGEAFQLTKLEQAIVDYKWFPDGEKLLLTLNVTPENADSDENKDTKRESPNITVITKAKYLQDGIGYLTASRHHLFMYDIESGELTQLTESDKWNAKAGQVSSDGNTVFYHANKTGEEYEGNENSDVFKLDLNKSTTIKLTGGINAQWNPVISPADQGLVYLHKDDTYEQTELYWRNPVGENVNLTEDFDRNINSPLWLGTRKQLLFLANDHGANRLFRLDIATKNVKSLLTNTETVRNLTIAPNGAFAVFSLENSISLPELYRLDVDTGELAKLTRFNETLLSDMKLSKAEDVWFKNDQGMDIQGFLHKPIQFEANGKYPLILNIKGGPGGMWGHQWFHENQMFAAKGYAVAYVNYRGSSGYGIKHGQAVRLDYGGADYKDNMQFLEHVLANNDWIDENKLYITGGSHGGFLTNWITTKTNRFKAAVTQRSISSWISEAGTQQITPRQMTKEFGGNLWDNFDYYWGRSPLKYADDVKTPTLIIHSDNDMITPIGQGQEWFYALKANDVDTEMVVFHDETHSLSRTGKPTNLVERIERILSWFQKY